MNPLHYLELCRYGLLNTPTVEREMALPAYYGFVRAAAAIGAFVGVLIGLVTMVGGGGIIALIITGFMWMLFSLAGYGIVLGFLAIVRAQIETRNAIIEYIRSKNVANDSDDSSGALNETVS
ncbi:MAG: hypothetical protein PF589_09395 [Gammaproteobacteria bacterium]|jgi:uncharacterized membrane protein|nr:hypothetical protein [Gammaproteobacteria bacterium]